LKIYFGDLSIKHIGASKSEITMHTRAWYNWSLKIWNY